MSDSPSASAAMRPRQSWAGSAPDARTAECRVRPGTYSVANQYGGASRPESMSEAL